MAQILITGGSGLLGFNWARIASEHHDVTLTVHETKINPTFAKYVYIDLLNPIPIYDLLRKGSYQIVIHTAAIADVARCQKSESHAFAVNSLAAANIAVACQNADVKLVHISTDHLSDGLHPFVSEDHPKTPLNVYAKSKALAEDLVTNLCPSSLIVRTNFFGLSTQYKDSFTDWILKESLSGRESPLFTDIYFSPIFIDELVNIVHRLIDLKSTGIVNVCGGSRLSKYQFACLMQNYFDFSLSAFKKAEYFSQSSFIPKPPDMSLSTQKAANMLGETFGELDHGLRALAHQYYSNHKQ